MTRTAIPNSLLFLMDSDSYVHRVRGQKLTFTPLSVKTLFEARPLLQPLSALLSVIFLERAPENSVLTERVTDLPPESSEDGGMVSVEKTTVNAIEARLYSEKRERFDHAIERALEALLSPKAQKFLAGLVYQSVGDSLDALLGEDEAMPDPVTFLLALPAPIFLEFLYGLYKANEGALGKLKEEIEARTGGKTSSNSSSPSPKQDMET